MFKISKLKLKRTLTLLLLALSFVLIFAPSFVPKNAEATFGFCKGLGPGLDATSSIPTKSVIAPNAANRKWTIQELFGNSTDFSVYDGETSGTTGSGWLLYDTRKADRGKGYPDWDNTKVKTKIQAIRSADRCAFGGMVNLAANVWLQLASAVVSGGTAIVAQLFNPTFICSSPKSPTNSCAINLVATIGGDGSSQSTGLIGNLFNGIYMPLLTLAFLCVGIWMIYHGLIKRQFRFTFSGFFWSIVILFVGIICMSHPAMLASAPQEVNSTIGSCIIGAMNGKSCLDGSSQAPSSLVGTECQSSADTNTAEGAEMSVNGMGCTLWKSFVLDSWSRAQFGRDYNDLYVDDVPKDGQKWGVGLDSDAKQYCIHLKSSKSANDFDNGQVTTDGGDPVCNLALYQLYLNSGLIDKDNTSTNKNKSSDYDSRYYNIILPATKDDTVWKTWAPMSLNGGGNRAISAFCSLIITIIAMASLVIFAFWGLVYSFAGTILMTFAPLFFLIGVEPGKGKRIFLGWLDSVVSSTLKYMASALFVIIALSMYAGILNNTDNEASAFIGILIMVGVMFTYRKEIINLIGQANIGGDKISNAVGERIHKKADSARELAAIGAGAGVGSVAAGGKFTSGLGEGINRRLMRDNSFVGGAAREAYMTRKRNGSNNPYSDKLNPNNPTGDGNGNGNGFVGTGNGIDSQNPNNKKNNKNDPNNKKGQNKKADDKKNDKDEKDEKSNPRHCPICGAKLNKDGTCPNVKNHKKFLGPNGQLLNPNNPSNPSSGNGSSDLHNDSSDFASTTPDKSDNPNNPNAKQTNNGSQKANNNSSNNNQTKNNGNKKTNMNAYRPNNNGTNASSNNNGNGTNSKQSAPTSTSADNAKKSLQQHYAKEAANKQGNNGNPTSVPSSPNGSSSNNGNGSNSNNNKEPQAMQEAKRRLAQNEAKNSKPSGTTSGQQSNKGFKLPPLKNADVSKFNNTSKNMKDQAAKIANTSRNIANVEKNIRPNNPKGPLNNLKKEAERRTVLNKQNKPKK